MSAEAGGRVERVRLLRIGWDSDLGYEASSPELSAGPGLVLLRVEACGVCHRDLLDRGGRFPFQTVPITPGHEAAGTVIAVGEGVEHWKVGDRAGTLHRDACGACKSCRCGDTSLCESGSFVLGILADGGYASHLLAPPSALYALPASLLPEEAASLQCTFGTAYRDLSTLLRLQAGERVVITGGNGGVGSAAIQVAVRLGAEVVAIVRDERRQDFVKALGAHEVIVDPGTGFHKRVGGADAALDTVGAPTFNAALRSLRIGGRIVVVGNVLDERVALNLGYMITRGLTLRGGSGATAKEMAELLALHARAPFQIPIDRVLPLSRADEAQRLVKAGGLQGRVVLRPGA